MAGSDVLDVMPGLQKHLADTVKFLRGIGISVHMVEAVSPASFLADVEVVQGALHATPSCSVSTLLHEAGHVACVPPAYRHLLSGDLARGTREMWRHIESLELHPDCPLMRAAIQCSDPEATAWAWAAGLKIGLPHESIILDSEYDGTGAWIRCSLKATAYVGIHGLMHAGLCQNPRRPGGYPMLRTWMQDVTLLSAPY
ncbi:hypothetical protein [Xanthomonas sacchari]|uniref:hypothetical protein n=1 Tax=Xanthomonas sacchari TaxID=56458 RepID=UPI00225E24A1|nr:hypothetical protein [Xanthomonas sacchari]